MNTKETQIKLNENINEKDINELMEENSKIEITKVPKYINKNVGKLIPIEDQINKIELEHIRHYIENEEEFQLREDEKQRPYVVFLNERIGKIIKKKNAKERQRIGFYIFIGTVITGGSLFGAVMLFGK